MRQIGKQAPHHGWRAALLGSALAGAAWSAAMLPAAAETETGDSAFSIPVDPAASIPTYRIVLKDGELLPPTLVVPARTRFRLHVTNAGTKPSEFESNSMRMEEVLFMGAETTLTATPLDPGHYDYFDEFQPGVIGKLISREVTQ